MNTTRTTAAEYKTAIDNFGIKIWTALCECKEHKTSAWVRISPADLAKVCEVLQADPFTEKGAKAIGHKVLSLVAKNA